MSAIYKSANGHYNVIYCPPVAAESYYCILYMAADSQLTSTVYESSVTTAPLCLLIVTVCTASLCQQQMVMAIYISASPDG